LVNLKMEMDGQGILYDRNGAIISQEGW
jgi:hypothetical protein